MGQIRQRTPDNQTISTDEIISEADISHGMKLCKSGLRPNQKNFIVI
jgi:hypothetical protein